MNERELRIGNLVKVGEKTIQVECIFLDRGINELYDYDNGFQTEYNSDEIKPIQLTEEWLLKFGFESDGTTYKAKLNGLRLILFQINASNNYNDNINEFTATVYQHKEAIGLCRIKFVHQLQNLFHSLSGEELTIKEIAK